MRKILSTACSIRPRRGERRSLKSFAPTGLSIGRQAYPGLAPGATFLSRSAAGRTSSAIGPNLQTSDAGFSRVQALRFLHRRHWNARNLHIDGEERAPGGEVEGLPVVAAEGHVGRRRLAVNDAAELLAFGIQDVKTAGAAGIDVTRDIDLHPFGHAGLPSAPIAE